ncbi:DUF3392 domain-containing protein [Marinibactrum halimedae]|uniref:Membrane protein n=1 Tax=Marinibactrum halimedae TaxID=1444977 RepID=A0AA37T9P9_9GAMM|nr:DUF3392 domain-containing protein [Marinibactrum halimedae]MCD9460932.1 DUF3392 domain-containing protein [Marinibactrum halimedae]GLS27403.1 membrane protein [Marinibactrum halimedae]
MNTILYYLSKVGQAFYPWSSEIAMAFLACLLVLLGSDINRFIRKQLANSHFILRTSVFILINAFGYGAFLIATAPWLARLIRATPAHWLCLTVIIGFIALGMWAEKKRYA